MGTISPLITVNTIPLQILAIAKQITIVQKALNSEKALVSSNYGE